MNVINTTQMTKSTLCILLAILLGGCTVPDSMPVLDSVKPADAFARGFMSNILNGQRDSCYAKVDSAAFDFSAHQALDTLMLKSHGAVLRKIRVAEATGSAGYFEGVGKVEWFKLTYEYEFERANVLFALSLVRKNNQFLINGINARQLPAPLSELTKFSLADKSADRYIFFFLFVAVPLFIVTSLFIMLFSKMPAKKKVLWFFIILLGSSPSLNMDWGTGATSFTLINVRLAGAGFTKWSLYSFWTLGFSVPIGAILFWIRRKRLTGLLETNQDEYLYSEHAEVLSDESDIENRTEQQEVS